LQLNPVGGKIAQYFKKEYFNIMKIMTTLGIPYDFTWCTLADIAAYPKFTPIVQNWDGPCVPVKFD
jgi:hypothetical protein